MYICMFQLYTLGKIDFSLRVKTKSGFMLCWFTEGQNWAGGGGGEGAGDPFLDLKGLNIAE